MFECVILSLTIGVGFETALLSLLFSVILFTSALVLSLFESKWLELELFATLSVVSVLFDLFKQLATSVGLCTECAVSLVPLSIVFCVVGDFCELKNNSYFFVYFKYKKKFLIC